MSLTEDATAIRNEPSRDASAPTSSFAAYAGNASLSALVPGLGLILTGRRRLGVAVLGAVATVLAVIAVVALMRPEDAVGVAVNPQALLLIAGVLALAAVGMIVNGLVSYRRLRQPERAAWQRTTVATLVTALVALTAVPLSIGSYYAWIQRDLVESVFTTSDDAVAIAEADPNRPSVFSGPTDPWADTPRLNVLLLGSDAGPGREGARTDTVMVASIDTATGDTTLFSLPRNLQQIPFPDGDASSVAYPYGFTGDGGLGSDLLNAVYATVPVQHPELFEGVEDPGAEAVKLAAEGILGIPVDYYVMVNMEGFQRLIDALGGVEINVTTTIPMENKVLYEGVCSEPTGYIYPGEQVLNGWEAMWYARARCGGEGVADDYDRMRRQRCVIGAMIDRSDPLTILRQFDGLAEATKDMVSSDIPQDQLSDFVSLALRVKDRDVRSLPFTNQVINPAYPDYAGIQAQVQAALDPPKKKGTGGGGGTAGSGDGTTSDVDGQDDSPSESDGVLSLDEVC